MVTLSTFPFELILAVAIHSHTSDIYALALTCRFICTAVTSVLYSRTHTCSMTVSQQYQLISTIHTFTWRSRYQRPFITMIQLDLLPRNLSSELTQHVRHALNLLPQLKDLSIWFGMRAVFPQATRVFSKSPTFQLETFITDILYVFTFMRLCPPYS